jgi:hypothetical protein
MKRFISITLSCFLLAALTAGCGTNNADATPRPLTQAQRLSLWEDSFADTVFPDANAVRSVELFVDRQLSDTLPADMSTSDCKFVFYGDDSLRVVNIADGWAVTLPQDDSLDFDYSLSALRSRFTTGNYTLNISKESNSYDNNQNGWDIYYDGWLTRFISNERFLHRNALVRTRDIVQTTDLLDGYIVHIYSIYITQNENIAQPYYHIAVVRENNDAYDTYFLFHFKSDTDMTETFDNIVASLKEFTPSGIARNEVFAFERVLPDWNEATLKYYEQLRAQDHVSWGFFTNSMPHDRHGNWDATYQRLRGNQDFLQEAFNHTFEIIPTYLHLGGGNDLTPLPNRMFAEFAGGDGFNGKPVLQLSYQFTTSNNTGLTGYTPMFDILNGHYDEHLRQIARGIRDYGYPVLFRLNNEMDSDWVSYASIVSLLDPDIFIMTWERMYRIFDEEGVNNCIWIFAPNGRSIPFSNWAEWQTYLPDISMVHGIGLSTYEMGNNDMRFQSFMSIYREKYERYTPYFEDYMWFISEFACGAGGAVRERGGDWIKTVQGRNQIDQADWVRGMFRALNSKNTDPDMAVLRNLRVAIWFSVNDYSPQIEGEYHTTNFLRITEDLTDTIEEFRKGFNPES